MGNLYQHPKYYEIAFSFRDVGTEVDVFEDLIRHYSRIPVARMLEIGCGPASHLPELSRRGYAYVGLDLSPAMLAYTRNQAQGLPTSVTLIEADMRNFHLPEPVDFAFVLLDSLFVQNTAELTAHFDGMSQALKPGSLYLLDWCVHFVPRAGRRDTWTLAQHGITVTTTYEATSVNRVEQTIEERISLVVEVSHQQIILRDVTLRRDIYPQEFLLFLDHRPDFEFVGWWNNWDMRQPLDGTQAINRPITVVRRV